MPKNPFIAGILKKQETSETNQVATRFAQSIVRFNPHVETIVHNALCMIWGQGQEAPSHNRLMTTGSPVTIFIGSLFERNRPQRVNQLDPKAAKKIMHDPTWLGRNYWGMYAGIMYDHSNNIIKLVRDPIGLQSLFYSDLGSAIIFSSQLSVLYDALEKKPSLNDEYLVNYVTGYNDVPRYTAFSGIQSVLPGECVTLEQRWPKPTLFYDPTSIRSRYIYRAAEYEEELQDTISFCIKAWMQDSPGASLLFNEVLDSSSLLIMLKKSVPDTKIITINCSDQKKTIHELAAAVGSPFYSLDKENYPPLSSDIIRSRHSAPSLYELQQGLSAQCAQIASEQGTPTIMSGHGGSQLFLASPPESVLSDAFLEGAFGNLSDYIQEIQTVHKTSSLSLFKTATQGILNYLIGRSSQPTKSAPSLLITPAWRSYFSPRKQKLFLADRLKKRHPAKAEHIRRLYQASVNGERDQFIPGVTVIHPLLSQPIVELAFQCPAYQTFEKGYDRFFLRKSASNMQNHQLLWQQEKNTKTSAFERALIKQNTRMRELLHDGILAQHNIIDQQNIDEQITNIKTGKSTLDPAIIRALATELWLNQWF